MTRLVVDAALLDELVAEMAAYDGRLDSRCTALAGRLRRLHLDWRGAAAADQAGAQHQLLCATEQMRDALDRLRAAADTAAANYRAAADANGRIWAC